MRIFDARTLGLMAAAIALAACHPPHDARPPYHEPAVASPATTAATPPAAAPPDR